MTITTPAPYDTGEIHRAEPTQRLHPNPLRRPDAAPFDKTAEIYLPQTIGIVDHGQPDTMPRPPRPTRPQYQPDAPSSPRPFPAPVPAGPKPSLAKVLVPLLRPAVPNGEWYAAQRARRGLPALTRSKGYEGAHRAGAR